MIAYAIGRIGCQVSGDGDWGIYNSAYISDEPGHVVEAKPGDFEKKLKEHSDYFLQGRATNPDSTVSSVTDRLSNSLAEVPHKNFRAPSFLRTWMVAYTFPNNVNEDGELLPDCEEKYCRALPQPVFPTSFYETIICSLLFLFLWLVRKKIIVPGIMFSIYLVIFCFQIFPILETFSFIFW